jgi:hypothetical protein
MQPILDIISGSCKPKGACVWGHLGLRYTIDLSRVMLLDEVNDHAGGLLLDGRLGHGTWGASLVRGEAVTSLLNRMLLPPDASRTPSLQEAGRLPGVTRP